MIKVSSAKSKGRTFQQYIAKRIADVTGLIYGKDEDIESRGMGQHGTDVILRGEAQRKFPFSVECKRTEKITIPKWIEQAKANTKEGTDWIIFFKRNREDALVVLDAEVFFNLMQKTIKK